jgi:hypothetical protein
MEEFNTCSIMSFLTEELASSARSFKIDIEIGGCREMPSKLSTRGNSECYYHQVGLGFVRALWTEW